MSYGISYGLSYRDIQHQEHAFHVARRAGFRLNGFLTYTPPRDMPPEERPRKFSQYRGHLGQELAIRNDLPFIAMFFREWKLEDAADAGEHLQGLIHLPNAKAMKIARSVFPDFVVIEWNDGPRGDFSRLLYLQKQRDHHAEGLVKKNHRPRVERELPAPVMGRRWSLSTPLLLLAKQEAPAFAYPSNKKFKTPPKYAAKRIKSDVEQEARAAALAVKTEPLRLRVVVNPLVPEPVQLSMFPLAERPVSRLAQYGGGLMPAAVAREIEARRHWRGLTQEALAQQIGLSRCTLTNALSGTFGLSQWAATRLREFLLPPPALSPLRAA